MHRNVAVLAASLFGLALGEELWQAYLPPYLSALGASGIVVGLFGSVKDLLDSLYQYPGGRITDRLGRRRALLIFTSLAMAGYGTYWLAPSWPLVFVGLFGVMAWKAGAFPTTFAVIGDSLPRDRRAVAFGIQSILVRIPRVIGAPLGGLAIVALGTVGGVRAMLLITLVLGLIVMTVQYFGLRDRQSLEPSSTNTGAWTLWVTMPRGLRTLLAVDGLVRIGEGIAASFIVLFVIQGGGFSAADFGVLYGIQHLVAIACVPAWGPNCRRDRPTACRRVDVCVLRLVPTVRQVGDWLSRPHRCVRHRRAEGNRRTGAEIDDSRFRACG